MDTRSWQNSSIKQNWFFDEKVPPHQAVEAITSQVLQLYERTAALTESLMAQNYHEHPIPPMQVNRCLACQTLDRLSIHLRPLFLHLDGIVMDFYNEPEHHYEACVFR